MEQLQFPESLCPAFYGDRLILILREMSLQGSVREGSGRAHDLAFSVLCIGA